MRLNIKYWWKHSTFVAKGRTLTSTLDNPSVNDTFARWKLQLIPQIPTRPITFSESIFLGSVLHSRFQWFDCKWAAQKSKEAAPALASVTRLQTRTNFNKRKCQGDVVRTTVLVPLLHSCSIFFFFFDLTWEPPHRLPPYTPDPPTPESLPFCFKFKQKLKQS